jgi:N-acetyl-anhydromuramyl-L-alanine amidase AmpD
MVAFLFRTGKGISQQERQFMPNIIDIPSPNWSSRDGAAPRWLIIHGTAGGSSAQAIGNYFAESASQVSSHYVVGQDGAIVRCVDENNAAWANGIITGPAGTSGDGVHHDPWWDTAPQWGGLPNPNPVTISIEHVKPDTDNASALTAAQQAASFALIKDICTRQNIPMRAANAQGGITGHYSMDPVNRSRCPGTFPWSSLWTYLQQGGKMIPTGWTDNGTTLTAPNGHKVVQGFRDYILSHAWDANDYPIEESHAQNPLELSNPDLGGGTQQTFRFSMLGWTAASGVIFEWLGQELLTVRTQNEQLKAQLATYQNGSAVSAAIQDLQTVVTSAQDALTKLKS